LHVLLLSHQQLTTLCSLSLSSFCLQNDPIPRVLLSVDPAFAMVKEWGAVQQLLQLRGWLLGDGSALSPSRFLFEVGVVGGYQGRA
jgi:hypothetical protein